MNVLVATRDPKVLAAVRDHPNAEAMPALDTGNVYKALPEVQLAVVEYRDLYAHPFSVELIRKLIDESGITQCSAQQFLASAASYLDRATPAEQTLPLVDCRTIAFTSYSGGTGKTSLALDTAYRFVERTRNAWLELPAAVFEFTYGGSALKALVGEGPQTLDALVQQPELAPFRLAGYALYPMQYDLLAPIARERTVDYLREQMSHYVLSILDTTWPHGLVDALGPEVDLWIIVATPRIDAVENATHLREKLAAEYGENRVISVVNKMGGLGDRLAIMGNHYELEIPTTKASGVTFEGRLGRDILNHVYDSRWQDYERARRRRKGLFRR